MVHIKGKNKAVTSCSMKNVMAQLQYCTRLACLLSPFKTREVFMEEQAQLIVDKVAYKNATHNFYKLKARLDA